MIAEAAQIERKRPLKLSITHKFCTDDNAEFNVDETRESPPYHHVAGWRVIGARKIAAQLRNFGDVA